MKFTNGNNSDFFRGLKKEVQNYFDKTGKAKTANTAFWVKGILLVGVYIGAYAMIYVFQEKPMLALASGIIMGMSGVMIVFNIVHDASHSAVSKHKWVNKALCYLGDWVGINTYIWDLRHNVQHHTYTNVLGGDLIIENIPLIRLNTHQPLKKFHRFQPIYTPFIYAFYTLYWIFVIDFKLFFQKEICNMKNIKHPPREWAILFFFKGALLLQMIVFPILFTSFTWSQVVLGFFIIHIAGGILLSFVAVLGHFVLNTAFPHPDEEGLLHNSWGEHELDATIDFAPKSRLVNEITGGLNTHIVHHLFPRVCHCHYYALTPIIKAYCEKTGYLYKSESLKDAVLSHFRYLQNLADTEVYDNMPVAARKAA